MIAFKGDFSAFKLPAPKTTEQAAKLFWTVDTDTCTKISLAGSTDHMGKPIFIDRITFFELFNARGWDVHWIFTNSNPLRFGEWDNGWVNIPEIGDDKAVKQQLEHRLRQVNKRVYKILDAAPLPRGRFSVLKGAFGMRWDSVTIIMEYWTIHARNVASNVYEVDGSGRVIFR